MKKIVTIICILLFAVVIAQAILVLPGFRSFQNKDVANWYLQNALENTGSANAVNAVVWDFRAYDTLGEEVVLFTAAVGVFLVARRRKYGHHH